ncbi:ABC transporter ATP-binding protein [Kiritimatiella glycovorans]|uniref:Multiple sugar ABC transporter, ATP-binding protein n=1 Tax=Kiritimatiella glycovorans TaxID=1307763 RepID=A0A0G3EEU4_9BACT|nr:sn-glycerol-3-phosphate ABC transporter ATP-binding protein UgpC [Kiritimatiella glycovorans]AKJ64986.1 Multiple sugar ABC transporter, ATP-binding protein [Kiritimatiella glycovorans]
MAQVRLDKVWKVFPGEVEAVKDVELDIRDREFMVLVGPSGCGKSTTLRMVAGLEEITRGDVYIGDRHVNDVPPKNRDIAMVFQNYALYPHMSVYKNMAFGLKLRKYPGEEIDRRVHEAAEILGLTGYLERKPKALSGGQRQRVAVGRAIVRKPAAFLFDEPLSNLDAKLRVQMRTEISKLHTRLNSTMIYVTHDQVEAMTLGDRICVLKDGLIQQVAEPMEIYRNPANKFVAGFIGSPPMNFFDGELEQTPEGLMFNGYDFKLALSSRQAAELQSHAGREVTFGIRPEDIKDAVYASGESEAQQITARVEVVEPMGSETILYLSTERHSFVARVEGTENPGVNQDIKLSLMIDRAHIFDRESEQALI